MGRHDKYGEGKHPVKKDKLNIFWDQCAHLNNRPSEDPYNFGQSVVEREESMDIAMITDQFALNKPLMSQTTSKLQIGSYAQNYIVKLPTVTNLAEGMILIFRRGFVIHKVNNTMFQEGRLVKIHKREPILIKIRKNGRMFSKSYIVHNG